MSPPMPSWRRSRGPRKRSKPALAEPTGGDPPSEEPEGCDHVWEMSGDPVEDDEPSGEFCGKCGEVRTAQGTLGI